jgi:hypothetical protein
LHPLDIKLQSRDLFCFNNILRKPTLKCLLDDNIFVPLLFELTLFLCHLLCFLLHLDDFILDHLHFFKVFTDSSNYLIPGTFNVPSFGVHIIH